VESGGCRKPGKNPTESQGKEMTEGESSLREKKKWSVHAKLVTPTPICALEAEGGSQSKGPSVVWPWRRGEVAVRDHWGQLSVMKRGKKRK